MLFDLGMGEEKGMKWRRMHGKARICKEMDGERKKVKGQTKGFFNQKPREGIDGKRRVVERRYKNT